MNYYFLIAGVLSSLAALLHVGCIYFGAPWYRLFGAGEQMALLAEQGSFQPAVITSVIALTLSIWAAYGFSAARLISKLPYLRAVLSLITLIYLVRGLAGFFFIFSPLGRSPEFWLWSSAICSLIGALHLVGLIQQWKTL